MLSQRSCNVSGKMSQEQNRILSGDDAWKSRAEATDFLIVDGDASSSNVHNRDLNESDHGDGFNVQKEDDVDNVRDGENSSDVITSALIVGSNGNDTADNITPADEMKHSANDKSDTVCNTNVIALSVIDCLIERLPDFENESSKVSNVIGKDNCNKSDNDVSLMNRTDHDTETHLECTINDVSKSSNIGINTSNIQTNDLTESFDSGSSVKHNLMTALELSPVRKHSLELICSNLLQEHDKIREAVHFNSPIAIIHEYSAVSEVLSDDNTDIISPSCSGDCPATQTAYLKTSVQDNDTTDITSLLKLDSDEGGINLDKESEKQSVSTATELYQTVCSEKYELMNEDTSNIDQDSEKDLGSKSKQVSDDECSSESQTSVHVLCGAADNVVKAECNERCVHVVAEVQLNCNTTKNDVDQNSQDIPSSSRSEELVNSNPLQSNVVLDEVQNHGTSEADQAAILTDAKSEYEILDEISGMNDCFVNLKVGIEGVSVNDAADFADVQFDRSTGNEIFQKEILTSNNETDRKELSMHILNHVESISSVQSDSIEHTADDEADVQPGLGDEELKAVAEVDGDMVKDDGNTAVACMTQEKHAVDDYDKNCQETNKLNDDVINGELIECTSDENNVTSITVKRELDITASPSEFSSVKRHKIDQSSGEITQRKRKLANEFTGNNEKVRKMCNDVDISEDLSVLQIPKMLKQLSSEKLASMDEDVVWECQGRNIHTDDAVEEEHCCKHDLEGEEAAEHCTSNDLINKKCNAPQLTKSDKEQCDTDNVEVPDVTDLKNEIHAVQDTNKNDIEDLNKTALNDSETYHIAEQNIEEVVNNCETNDLTNENEEQCNAPEYAANDNFKKLCETTVTGDAEVPDLADLKNKTEIQSVICDSNKYEVEGPNKSGLDDPEAYTIDEQNIDKLIPADDQIVSSCKFITATEYLSQSSHNSGSQGFVFDASESVADICVGQSLNIETVEDVRVVQESQKEALGHNEIDEPCVDTEEKESKTVIMYEIDETDLKEERMVVPSNVAISDICDVTKNTGKMVTHDEDEQMDTALLDLYVDKAVDQMVPSYENNGDKLYVCDVNIFDDQGISVCKPRSEKGTSPRGQGCFKWKYTPSCDSDVHTPELPDEDQVIRITPLKTCGKPLRLGLSRRQPMKNSLHKIVRH